MSQPRTTHDTAWRTRLQRALSEPLSAERAAPGETRRASETGGAVRRAAVLLPVIGSQHPTLYFTQRSHAMPHHAGQISFPGGRVDRRDASVRDAALREAHEEIGLAPSGVEILGRLPLYQTVTGFAITPFVGWLAPNTRVAADQREVTEVFGVPLAFALDHARFERQTLDHSGRQYTIYAIEHEGRYIWGATAGILYSLLERLAIAEGREITPPAITGVCTLDDPG